MDKNLNEQKINNWLDEIEKDRNKLFNEIKSSNSSDAIKERKIKALEHIQRTLLIYKNIITKEKAKNDD